MSQPEPTNRPRWTFENIALVVIGLLILVPSGSCTVLSVFSLYPGGEFFLPFILLFGGALMAIGAALVYAGLKSPRRD